MYVLGSGSSLPFSPNNNIKSTCNIPYKLTVIFICKFPYNYLFITLILPLIYITANPNEVARTKRKTVLLIQFDTWLFSMTAGLGSGGAFWQHISKWKLVLSRYRQFIPPNLPWCQLWLCHANNNVLYLLFRLHSLKGEADKLKIINYEFKEQTHL